MKIALQLLLATLLLAGAPLSPTPDPTTARPPSTAMWQPPPQPEDEAGRPGVSLKIWLALVCICNLSLIALLGSLALKRRFDSINPEK